MELLINHVSFKHVYLSTRIIMNKIDKLTQRSRSSSRNAVLLQKPFLMMNVAIYTHTNTHKNSKGLCLCVCGFLWDFML